jgi:Na+/serine symporter
MLKKKNLNWSLLIVLVESLILISIVITKLHLAAFFRSHPVYLVCQKVRTSVSVA